MKMKTQIAVAARYKDRHAIDAIGFETADYTHFMTKDTALFVFGGQVIAEDWKQRFEPTPEKAEDLITGYMPFAWDYANKCQSISAIRSIGHMIAWHWVLGDGSDIIIDKLSDTSFQYYGKGILAFICEYHNIPWWNMDNDRWTNSEECKGLDAVTAFAKWKASAEPLIIGNESRSM